MASNPQPPPVMQQPQQQQQPGPPHRFGPPQPPTPPAPKPYTPTPEEQVYMQVIGDAVVKGAQAASTAADAGDGQTFLSLANGVKSLTQAYAEIKTGGKAATGHQGG